MKNLKEILSTTGSIFRFRSGRPAALCPRFWITFLVGICNLHAGNQYVLNASFESVATQFADPRIDLWQKTPQPANFDTNVFGSWDNLSGVFLNPTSTNAEHIVNALGGQLAYLFSYPGAGLFQDYDSTDWSNAIPTHGFNSKFVVGKSYTVTVGLTSSSQEPLTPGATLSLGIYYRDPASNKVVVASTTVEYDTNVFSNLTQLIDFHVNLPEVKPTDPWAGQNIGIQIMSTVPPNLLGGVWDLDNVRLIENLAVPNFSFESVATQFADPRIDSWQKLPQPTTFDTNIFGAWDNLAGVFHNTAPTNSDFIGNAEGGQLAYVFAYPQAGFFQDYDSTDWSNGTPTHQFDSRFSPGRSYTLTVGLTSSSQEPLTQGSALLLSVYYRDAASNKVNVATTTVTFDTNVFAQLTKLLDFEVEVPVVKEADPWAGKNIGIEFQSIVAPNLIGGVWDLDNVRLTEFQAPALVFPGQNFPPFHFTLQSEPGQVFEVQAASDLSSTGNTWSVIGTITNASGMSLFTDTSTNLNHRFYRAHAL